ncbi:uncharacterized protein LOC124145937 [Haliotis rufescens]|uniref:uncharacterized protein LOC124145937 n=1 Tax=Haliotis rufescens TaxID=6454 RepID=UPI00201F69A8|nr:uncharacterized protein LOC124145937 [Haliotis rufescens]
MESFYRTSYLAAAFRDCVIRSFSPDSKIEFDIQFETPVFPNLQSYILSVFESQAPRLNMSGHNVLDVGDLYLIWGNYSYVIVTPDPEISTITWVPPSSFVPTSTIQPEPTSTIVMTSSVVPTTPAPRDWVVAMFNYSMFDFTWMPELADRTSMLYKLYENKFCNDIERFYRPTYLNRAFRDCEITSFGKDSETIEFRVSFDTPVFPSLQGDILYFLEDAAPRFNISTYTVMDVGDIYLIWKNFSYAIITPEPIITTIMWTPSSSITPTSTTQVTTPSITPTTPTTTTEDPSLNWLHAKFDFRLLDFSYLPDLADPNSQLYQIYERKFCDDMRRFYDQSYLSMVYRGCKIREFHPDGRIQYHLALETPVFPNLMSDIIATLYKGAPKMDIRQHEVLDVGGLLLVWSNYTLQIVPPQPYSTTLFWTPPSSTPPVTTTTIESSFSSVEMTSSIYTTPEPPEYVLAIFRFGLLDFPYHPDLANKDSMLFKLVQKKFCDDIRKLYQRTYLSVVFRECHISEFGTDPDTFKFYIAFETPVFNRLQGDILNVLETEAPRLNMYGYTVLDIGELFLMWANFSYILVDKRMKSTIQWAHTVTPTSTYTTQSTITTTTMPTTTEATYQLKLSFEVLNLTMSETLRNVNSAEFKLREQLFCNDISQLLLNHPFKFPDYKSCRFDQFTSDPLRINYSLVFIGQQPEEMSERVVGILIEGAPRENYLDLIGLRVGNMLIAIDNFTVHIHDYSTLPPLFTTPPVSYDALLYNITFKMFPGNYSTAMQDTSSSYYRQITKRFCSEIRQYFGNSYVRDRYYSCKVDGITGGRNPTLNANVIVSGTYDFGAPLIYDVINSSASVFNFGGRRWLRIGDFLLYADSPGESILIQWGYISTTPAPTTPLPSTFTILDLRANILNMTYNPAFALTSSAAFRSYAIPFCQFLGKKFTERNRFPDYFGCRVVSISNNPFSVRFSLRFRGMQEEFLQALVPDILIEWTRTPEADRLIVGPLTLDERSIRVKQRYISDGNIVTRGPLRTTPSVFIPTTPAPPTTTAGSNPCPPGAFNTIEPHRSQCNKFYLCNGGVAMEMTCAPGQILDAVYRMCILKPPGHVCQL